MAATPDKQAHDALEQDPAPAPASMFRYVEHSYHRVREGESRLVFADARGDARIVCGTENSVWKVIRDAGYAVANPEQEVGPGDRVQLKRVAAGHAEAPFGMCAKCHNAPRVVVLLYCFELAWCEECLAKSVDAHGFHRRGACPFCNAPVETAITVVLPPADLPVATPE
jgi:hypothetical protein